MAQYVNTGIDIEDINIKQFSSLTLSQGINQHHRFRLVCPTEAIDGTSGSVLNISKNMVGGKITVQVSAVESAGMLQFSGMVTAVEASRHSSHTGDIILSGFSPTIMLDSGPHCKSWEKKAVKNIAQDVLKHFPQNLLHPVVSPTYGQTLAYTVQYKETAWQFLNRLSATYCEWFFYDGQKLVLGIPQGEKAELTYGSNLEHFTMALQVQPARFQLMAYDYINSEVYDGTPFGIADKAGLNYWGKHVLQKSEQFYESQPKQWHNHFLTNKKQLDDFINIRAAAQSSNMVRFKGSSSHPGLQVGGAINVQGKNVFSGKEEAFGNYTVISVNHYCDGQGHYTNDFEAIPASIKIPPVTVYREPHSETQSAFVTDNHDPKGLGRIRVKFHWMNGAEKTPWIRVTSPHGGGGKGMFFIPEIGEEVIVGFEGDSAVKPYVIGTVYHGKANNSYSNGGNDVKALQTRSGNKMIMNDKDGSIFIEDMDGNSILNDGKGNITMLANKTITLVTGGSQIFMKEDGTINITGKDITIVGSASVTAVSGGEGSSSGVNIVPQSITMGAVQNIVISSGVQASLGSPVVNIAGAKTNVVGDTISVNGSGDVTVVGGLVKINS